MRQIPSIKTRQRFKATPQLRNAIGLLQLSGSELQLEIQQAIETNALLEVENNNPQQFVHEDEDTNAVEEWSTNLKEMKIELHTINRSENWIAVYEFIRI